MWRNDDPFKIGIHKYLKRILLRKKRQNFPCFYLRSVIIKLKQEQDLYLWDIFLKYLIC